MKDGEAKPYQARFPVFQTDDQLAEGGAAGVKVAEVVVEDKEPIYRYQPDHPLAIKDGPRKGYVAAPTLASTNNSSMPWKHREPTKPISV